MTVQSEEMPRAYIVLQPEVTVTAEDLQEFVAKKVAKHKRLTGGIKFIQEVPKFPSGKIVRKVIKEWARSDARNAERSFRPRL